MTAEYRQRGFSLLEVMVALVIAALVCGLAFNLIGQSSRAAWTGSQYQQALLLAESQMTLLTQQPQQWLGQQSGTLAGDFRWRARVQIDEAATGKRTNDEWTLYRIDLQLLWPDSPPTGVQLSTLKLGRKP